MVKVAKLLSKLQARERLNVCDAVAHDGTKQCTVHHRSQTGATQSKWVQAQKTHLLCQGRRQLICLSEYRMCQRATAVNQISISPGLQHDQQRIGWI